MIYEYGTHRARQKARHECARIVTNHPSKILGQMSGDRKGRFSIDSSAGRWIVEYLSGMKENNVIKAWCYQHQANRKRKFQLTWEHNVLRRNHI